jgi:2-C-methyl-D-erythritol 4-phosphate cytidylyltransferase
LLPLGNATVLGHALAALLEPPEVGGAVVPCAPDLRERIAEEVVAHLETDKPVVLTTGGATRQDSVRAGLEALPEQAAWVLVHDGARPNPTPGLIRRLLDARARGEAWLPVLPVTDTLKRVDEDGRVRATVDRGPLRRAQTPQLFARALIVRAHAAGTPGATDDAALVEALGEPVGTVEGAAGNMKLTLPGDLGLLRYWMERREP